MLHNNKELFEQAVLKTAEYLNIDAGIVEKDYYVTLMFTGEKNLSGFVITSPLAIRLFTGQPHSRQRPLGFESHNNLKNKKRDGTNPSLFSLVRPTGLEPVRPADTSTSSLPVCQFQHSRKFTQS